MKTLVIRESSLQNFLEKIKPKIKKVDVILINFCFFNKINYSKEIAGINNNIKKLVKLSKEFNCVVIAGAECNLFSKKYCSILVCEEGELLGIADSVYNNDKYASGNELKIYDTKVGKIGIIVNTDILSANCASILEAYGAEYIVNLSNELDIETLNKKVVEEGKKNNLSFLCVNKNSIIEFNKHNKQNNIMFNAFVTKDF